MRKMNESSLADLVWLAGRFGIPDRTLTAEGLINDKRGHLADRLSTRVRRPAMRSGPPATRKSVCPIETDRMSLGTEPERRRARTTVDISTSSATDRHAPAVIEVAAAGTDVRKKREILDIPRSQRMTENQRAMAFELHA